MSKYQLDATFWLESVKTVLFIVTCVGWAAFILFGSTI
jgi:hypothetical protein